MGNQVVLDKINPSGIIGLPPQIILNYGIESPFVDTLTMKWVMASMPVAVIQPAYPKIAESSSGLHLFTLDFSKGREKYNKNLQSAGYTGSSDIKVAYLNETSITETWQNEFGPSQMEDGVNGIGNGMLSDISTAAGTTDTGNALSQVQDKVKGILGSSGVAGAQLLDSLTSLLTSAAGGISGVEGMGPAANKLRAGAKVDFPSIWKNSSYQSNYSITVRLYNPFPHDVESYKIWIVEPLIRLIALALPLAEDGDNTYSQCVSCAVECPGLWKLKAGYLSSLEVIKGSDANDINFFQHPNMVDVRLTFGELYGVMVGESTGDNPSLKDYKENLLNEPIVDLNMYVSSTAYASESTPIITNDVTESSTMAAAPRISDSTQQISNNLEAARSAPQMQTNEDIIENSAELINNKVISGNNLGIGSQPFQSLTTAYTA